MIYRTIEEIRRVSINHWRRALAEFRYCREIVRRKPVKVLGSKGVSVLTRYDDDDYG